MDTNNDFAQLDLIATQTQEEDTPTPTPAACATEELDNDLSGKEDTLLDTSKFVNAYSAPAKHERGESWGYLQRGSNREELYSHAALDGKLNLHTLGRSKGCDIVFNHPKISSRHAVIYGEFDPHTSRTHIFIEDQSQNGTYINDVHTHLEYGKRYELRSGDEVFLLFPETCSEECRFIFVNKREREISRVERTVLGSNVPLHGGQTVTEQATTGGMLGKYEIGSAIGSGSCGNVHVCVDRTFGNEYAVKIIDTRKFSLSPGSASIHQVAKEAEMMRILHHQNIIRVQDTWQTSHAIYIVMELVRGGDLLDRIVSRGPYKEEQARNLMHNLLGAVKYLHDKQIVHRDIKPDNILLVDPHDDTNIKITDFGLAKRLKDDGLKTFCGTPQYVAPEVLKRRNSMKGHGRYGREADMWSIGVVLYILLSGCFPFDDDGDESLFSHIEHGRYTMNGEEWANVSVEAKDLVKSLLTIDPLNRLSVRQAIQHCWIQGQPLPRTIARPQFSHSTRITDTSQLPPIPKPETKSSGYGKGTQHRRKRSRVAHLQEALPHLQAVPLKLSMCGLPLVHTSHHNSLAPTYTPRHKPVAHLEVSEKEPWSVSEKDVGPSLNDPPVISNCGQNESVCLMWQWKELESTAKLALKNQNHSPSTSHDELVLGERNPTEGDAISEYSSEDDTRPCTSNGDVPKVTYTYSHTDADTSSTKSNTLGPCLASTDTWLRPRDSTSHTQLQKVQSVHKRPRSKRDPSGQRTSKGQLKLTSMFVTKIST